MLSDWEILTKFLKSLKVNDPKAQFRSNVMAEQSRASRSLAQLYKSDESTLRVLTQQVWSSASERKRFPRVTSQLDRLLACSSSFFCSVLLRSPSIVCVSTSGWLSFLSGAGEESKKQQRSRGNKKVAQNVICRCTVILQIPPTFFVPFGGNFITLRVIYCSRLY